MRAECLAGSAVQGKRFAWGRTLFGALTAAVLLTCGGGGGGGSNGLSFRCEDSGVAVDTVALACNQRSGKDTWRVQLVIAGPTSSSAIHGLNLDVVFDPATVAYVTGSASLGDFLSQDGNSPLLAAAVAVNDPGRLIVGVHRTQTNLGVGISSGQAVILNLSFRANMLTRFGPVLMQIQNAEALDSNGTVIPSVLFSDQILLSVE